MNKQEFTAELCARLSALPEETVEDRISFYIEAINDRIDDGMSESDAVADVGNIDGIVSDILSEIPLSKIANQKIKSSRHLRGWEITLLAVGSPVWFPLAIAALAVIFSLYVSAWAIVASFWAAFGSFAGGGFGGVVSGIVFICTGNAPSGIALIASGLVCAGLAIFSFFGCLYATKGTARLAKIIVLGIKKCLIKKEATK